MKVDTQFIHNYAYLPKFADIEGKKTKEEKEKERKKFEEEVIKLLLLTGLIKDRKEVKRFVYYRSEQDYEIHTTKDYYFLRWLMNEYYNKKPEAFSWYKF